MVLLTIFSLMLMFALAATALLVTAWMHDKIEELWLDFRQPKKIRSASLTVLPPFPSSETKPSTAMVSEKIITLSAQPERHDFPKAA